MNKSQFDQALQAKLRGENRLDLNAYEVKTVMDAAASLLLETIAEGGTISVHKLGVFGSRVRPSTGIKVPYFKPSRKMRAICDELGLNAHMDKGAAHGETDNERRSGTADPDPAEGKTAEPAQEPEVPA